MIRPFSKAFRIAAVAAVAMALTACATSAPIAATTTSLPPPSAAPVTPQVDYRIGPLDRISVSVFQVPELSQQNIQVDTSGQVNLPLIGLIQASGKTANQLSSEIAAKLGQSYLQSPQVSVMITEANSQKVTVEGAVALPGIFPIAGPTTLLQVIAMAKGPDKAANTRRVGIFRTVEGRRAAAVFDLEAIRAGRAEDPRVYGDDIVVVQGSGTKSAWQEVLRAIPPVLGIFRFF